MFSPNSIHGKDFAAGSSGDLPFWMSPIGNLLGIDRGFADRWSAAKTKGDEVGLAALQNTYSANETAANIGDQGRNNLLTDLTGTADIYDMANQQTLERMRMEYLACVNSTGDERTCRARFDAAVGRTPQTQTQAQNMTPNPNAGPSFTGRDITGY